MSAGKEDNLFVLLGRSRRLAREMQNRTLAIKALRPEVLAFAIEMEKVLRDNDYKGGWKNAKSSLLLQRLKEEVRELSSAVKQGVDKNDCVRAEAVDVANFCVMLADQSQRMGEELPEDLAALAELIK